MIDKSLILNKIKQHLGFKKESDFANFLGIKQNTLSSWHSRNSFDIQLISQKCEEINYNWLLTGEGQMLKSQSEENHIKEPIINYNTPKIDSMDEKERIGILEEAMDIMKKELADKQRTIDALTETNRELISYVTGTAGAKKKEAS